MLAGKQDKICFECHGEVGKNLAAGKSRHRPVAQGECTKCHNPHKAKLKGLLLAKGADACLVCHEGLKKEMAGKKVHSPAKGECETCHVPHSSREASLLAKSAPELCGECHETKDAAFAKSHIRIEPNAMDCKACHDPHASNDPKFFKKVMHGPFAAGSCDDCHEVPR
jgi:predicted CXXCH cytochrome family protein